MITAYLMLHNYYSIHVNIYSTNFQTSDYNMIYIHWIFKFITLTEVTKKTVSIQTESMELSVNKQDVSVQFSSLMHHIKWYINRNIMDYLLIPTL